MTRVFFNAARGVLATGISAYSTQIWLAPGGAFPVLAPGETLTAVLQDSSGIEIVDVTASTGLQVTVVRGREGTQARAFAQGSVLGHRLTAADATRWERPAKPPVTIPLWFLESGTWTAPVKGRAIVHMLGAGGCGSKENNAHSSGGGAGAWGMNYFDLNAGDVLQLEIGAGSVPPSSGTNYVDGGASILRINSVQKMHIPGGRHGEQPLILKATDNPTGVLSGCRGYSPYYQNNSYSEAKNIGGWVAFQNKEFRFTNGGAVNSPKIVFDPNDWGVKGKFFNSTLGLGVLHFNEREQNQMGNDGHTTNGLGMGATRTRNGGLAGRGGGGYKTGSGRNGYGGDGYAFVRFYAEV